jgi:hypothetical protein
MVQFDVPNDKVLGISRTHVKNISRI